MPNLLTVALAALLSLTTSAAFAQPDRARTGTVDATVGGEPMTLHTFVAHVPEDVAEGIEDDEARAIAERAAGTDQHTATWMVTDPVMAGDTEIAPSMMFLMVDARAEGDPETGGARLDVEFAIDPATLQRLPGPEVAIEYHPAPYEPEESYATTEGTVTLDEVEQVDEDTLAVRGTIGGVLEYQGSSDVEQETIEVEGTFRIDQAVGATRLSDLLGE